MKYKLTLQGSNPLIELHNSGADTIKIFDTIDKANELKDELNSIKYDNVLWEVTPVSAVNKTVESGNDTAKI